MKLISKFTALMLKKRKAEADHYFGKWQSEQGRANALLDKCETLNDACHILAVRAGAKPVELNQLGVRLREDQVAALNDTGGNFGQPRPFDDISAMMREADRGKQTAAKFRILKKRFQSLQAYVFGLGEAIQNTARGNRVSAQDLETIREVENTLRMAHGTGMEIRDEMR